MEKNLEQLAKEKMKERGIDDRLINVVLESLEILGNEKSIDTQMSEKMSDENVFMAKVKSMESIISTRKAFDHLKEIDKSLCNYSDMVFKGTKEKKYTEFIEGLKGEAKELSKGIEVIQKSVNELKQIRESIIDCYGSFLALEPSFDEVKWKIEKTVLEIAEENKKKRG